MENQTEHIFDVTNTPKNRADIAAKHAAQAFPNDMLQMLLGTADFEFVQQLESELPTVDVRLMDSLTKILLRGEPTLIHREYQTGDSHPIPVERRNAGYLGRVHERFGLPIISYVIYLREPAGRRDPGVYLQKAPGSLFIVQYNVVRLYELAGEPILEAQLPGLMPFVPLMKPPIGMDAAAWLQQCVDVTQQLELDASLIDNLLMSTGALGSLILPPETVISIISEELMKKSPVYQLLSGETEEAARQNGLQQGLQQGRQEGIEIGIIQGARETTIDTLMRVLEVRFQLQEAQALKPVFEAVTDVQHLKQVLDTAIQAPDLDAVIQTLTQNRTETS